MRNLLRNIPVKIIGLFLLGVGHRPSILHQIIHDPILKRNRVGNGWFLELVDCIIDLEDFPTDQLIITIHEETNFVRIAVVRDGIVDVRYSSDSLLIDDQPHLPIIDVILLEEAVDEEPSVISRCVVDDDDMVVGVLLVKDGLQVELIAEGLGVVVGGNDDAEGQFGLVATQVVGLLHPPLLPLEQLLHPAPVVGRSEGSLEIGLLHQPVIPAHLVAEVVVPG